MYIIDPEQIVKWNREGKQVMMIDCRFSLSDPNWGRNEYEKNHITGAVYFDLEKDMSGSIGQHGGRHPLPQMETFKDTLEKKGINNQSILAAYDQGGAPFASRFWWMMKYIGHKEVYVVNGGYPHLLQKHFQVDNLYPDCKRTSYTIDIQTNWLASMEEVKQVVNGQKRALLIDSREHKRYIGEIEPIDIKKGHIPGAINLNWQDGIESGQFKTQEQQAERFKELSKQQEIIVYCGSGVTAAPNMLLLKDIGYENVKLYIGSFSDWISYDANLIETGDPNQTKLINKLL